MGVLKPRTRIVTFRLAEEEFERIKNICAAAGARSMSDYARNSLCNSMGSREAQADAGLDARVGKLDQKVEELDQAVKVLTRLVGDGLGARSRKKITALDQGQ